MSETTKEREQQSPRTWAIDLAEAIYAKKNELYLRRVREGNFILRQDEIAAYVEIIEAELKEPPTTKQRDQHD